MDADDVVSTAGSIASDLEQESPSGVYSASRLLLQLSRGLGILPAEMATVEEVVKEPSRSYRPHLGTRVYSACLFLLAAVLGCVTIYYRATAMVVIMDTADPSSNHVRLYFKLAYTLITLVFCVVYVIFSRITGDTFSDIFSSLDTIDDSLKFSDHTAASKRALRHVLFASFVIILGVSDCYILAQEFSVASLSYFANVGWFMHILILMCGVMIEQQFMALCLALKERFVYLNLQLISLQPLVFPVHNPDIKFKKSEMTLNDQLKAMARSEFADVMRYTKRPQHEEGGLFRVGHHIPTAWGEEKMSARPPMTPMENLSLKARLALLRRVHDNLCDVMGSVNTMYGVCLLGSICFIFVGVLSLSYYVVTNALYPTGGGSDIIVNLVQSIVWLLYLSSRLIGITWACASTTKEAQRAGPLHQKLTKRTLDTSTKEELHLFSTQLLQRDIGFTVCGLFPLDFTLLYTVAGAVTTYLVILIQFQSVQSPKSASPANVTTIKPQMTT